MGHFKVSCALSGLAIRGGDPCYYIPLIESKYAKGKIGGQLVVSNEGAQAIFDPAFLPILGEYSDYGTLDNPVENDNTKRIEELLNTTIKEFLNDPCQHVVPQKQFVYVPEDQEGESHWENVDVQLAGCFIHKFAYETAYQHTMNTDNDSFATTSCYYVFPVCNYILDLIGLDKPKEDKKEERYKYIYKIEGVDSHVIQSDGEYSQISKVLKKGYQDVGLIHNVKGLQEEWKKITGHTLEVPESIKTLHISNKGVDKAQEVFAKSDKASKKIKKLKNKLKKEEDEDKRKGIEAEIGFAEWDVTYLVSAATILQWLPCINMYKDLIASNSEDIRLLICELQSLSMFMYANSKMFMPTLSGPQDGDTNSEMALSKANQKYLDKRIKSGYC